MAKVLIVADPGDKCSAVPRGLDLAHKLGVDVEVVAFGFASFKELGAKGRENQQQLKTKLLEKRERKVSERIAQYRKDGQKVSLHVVWAERIHDWINKRVAKGYQGVMKTAHRSGGFAYTSTDWLLLRECPVPVYLVADKRWSRTKPILATVDLSTSDAAHKSLNDKVIRAAKDLARMLDTELGVINALHISPVLTELDLVDPHTHARKLKKQLEPEIERLAEQYNLPKSTFVLKRGPVAKVITSEAARIRAQMVVMGTVGRTGVKARVIGNTAEQVLQRLNTDILALKP